MLANVHPMETRPPAGADFDDRMGAVADNNSTVCAIRWSSAGHL